MSNVTPLVKLSLFILLELNVCETREKEKRSVIIFQINEKKGRREKNHSRK